MKIDKKINLPQSEMATQFLSLDLNNDTNNGSRIESIE